MPDGRPQYYVTTTQGMSGYFAVCMWWAPEYDGFREPWQTGVGRYATQAEAVVEAKQWAESDDMEYFE